MKCPNEISRRDVEFRGFNQQGQNNTRLKYINTCEIWKLGKAGEKVNRYNSWSMIVVRKGFEKTQQDNAWSVQMRSFFWSLFSCIRTRKTPYLDTCHAVRWKKLSWITINPLNASVAIIQKLVSIWRQLWHLMG